MSLSPLSIEKTDKKNRYIIKIFNIKIKIKLSGTYIIHSLIKCCTPLFRLLDKVVPKKNNKVVFTSYPDFSDSAKIFYDYINKIQQDKFKNLIWIYTEENADSCVITRDKYYFYSIKGIYNLLTAKYIIHDHCNKVFSVLTSNKRVMFNLWHGMPIKAIGQLDENLTKQNKRIYKYFAKTSYMFVISDVYRIILSSMFGMNPNKIYVTGQARTDVMFDNSKQENITKELKIDTSKQIVIYTPTYKKRLKNIDVKTAYDNIFYLKDYSDQDFLKFLEQNNILLIIKPHPFEQEEFKNNIKKSTLSNNENVRILYDEDFIKNDLMLNEIFALSDLMISDFSSVTIDYSMLNKPILYLNNYVDEYKQGRGFILPDNYKIMMPGENISTYDDLKKKILECLENKHANYTQNEVNFLHKYQDGHSCERIFEVMKGI